MIEGCPHGPATLYPSGCPHCYAESQTAQQAQSEQVASELATLKLSITYERDQIVYCQGVWACRVESDEGDSLVYEPLEGYGPNQEKHLFRADKTLFTPWRQNQTFHRSAIMAKLEKEQE